MEFDDRIFLSRPDIEVEGSAQLGPELCTRARRARRIVILSAYYGIEFLQRLLWKEAADHRHREITIVLDVENPNALPFALARLREFHASFPEQQRSRLTIKLMHGQRPFHVKLYYFCNYAQHHWFIGSANASGAVEGGRQELMVRGRGRHQQLEAYRDAVIATAVDIENVEAAPLEITDLRSFFLCGSIAYRPTRSLVMTFEACRIDDEHRGVLRRALDQEDGVPYADADTNGFGFNLVSALRAVAGDRAARDGEDEGRGANLPLRQNSIETAYGYWLPQPFADELSEAQRQMQANKRHQLLRWGEVLRDLDPDLLEIELNRHVVGLQAFFQRHGLAIEPRANHREAFRRFLDSTVQRLTDEDRVQRLVEKISIEPMPDIWCDVEAAERFEDFFFEDLASRFRDRSRSRVRDVLEPQIDCDDCGDPKKLRKALIERLKKGFGPRDWLQGEDGERDGVE